MILSLKNHKSCRKDLTMQQPISFFSFQVLSPLTLNHYPLTTLLSAYSFWVAAISITPCDLFKFGPLTVLRAKVLFFFRFKVLQMHLISTD